MIFNKLHSVWASPPLLLLLLGSCYRNIAEPEHQPIAEPTDSLRSARVVSLTESSPGLAAQPKERFHEFFVAPDAFGSLPTTVCAPVGSWIVFESNFVSPGMQAFIADRTNALRVPGAPELNNADFAPWEHGAISRPLQHGELAVLYFPRAGRFELAWKNDSQLLVGRIEIVTPTQESP